jgi:hypothetical protein
MIGKIQDYSSLTSDSIWKVQKRLTDSIAYKSQARYPWTFYEVLDEILGGYGPSGYPTAQGKFYCMAFNANKSLMSNPSTANWVKMSTVKLQEELTNFVVDNLKKNKGRKITESELKNAAQRAYSYIFDDGGLRSAIAEAPDILPIIRTLPGKEGLNHGPDFRGALSETFNILERILPDGVIDYLVSSISIPNFSSLIRMSYNLDKDDYTDEMTLNEGQHIVSEYIITGYLDDYDVLNFIVDALKFNNFDEDKDLAMARTFVMQAEARMGLMRNYYAQLRSVRPTLDIF